MRKVYVCRDGKFVEVKKAPPRPRIAIHCDSMAPLWHPVDGRYYDSKSAFRQVTKAAGADEIHEVVRDITPHSFEDKPLITQEEIRQIAAESYEKLQQGYNPRLDGIDPDARIDDDLPSYEELEAGCEG